MNTIIKITLGNLGRKKFRTILITLSIILSVALLYTVLSMSGTITDIMEQKMKKETGNSELIISPDEKAASPYMEELDFTKLEGLSYHIPKLLAYGYTTMDHKKINVAFHGMDFNDYETIYPAKELSGDLGKQYSHPITISSSTAKEYNLSIGDDINATLAGESISLQVSKILKDQNNNLGYELGSLSLLMPRADLGALLGAKNQVNFYYIKSEAGSDIAAVQERLEKTYPNLKVQNLEEMQDYKQMISSITGCLMLMVLAVIMISTFIIYSSFKIIVIERMPYIGTLRSIGATKRKTNSILLFESMFYGVIGGIIGCLLGVFLLTLSITLFLKSFGVTIEDVSYINLFYLVISFAIGLLLMLVSTILPIIKSSNKSIRSIIFAEIHNDKHFSYIKNGLGFLLIASAFLLFRTSPVELRLPLDVLGLLMVCIGASMVIPFVSLILTQLLSLIFRPIFKDSLGITTANIKNDRTMMNNISLLAMGLGVILMINNFSSAVSTVVCDVYATSKSDLLAFYPMNQEFLVQLPKVDGVEHIYTTNGVENVKANNGKVTIPLLTGIDGENYSNYAWNEFGSYFTKEVNQEFEASRSIILSKFLARKYNLKLGENLTFDFDGITRSYKIIAIVPTIMNNGSMSFVNKKFLTEDGKVQNDDSLYINLKDGADKDKVKDNIIGLMPNAILPLQSIEDMQKQNENSNNAIFFLMKAISLIAMFIGVVGIFNNFTISFLSRKKVLATLRSLGVSKIRTIRNLIFEAFLCGCIGTLSGLAFGTLLLKAMCYVVEAIGIPADVIFLNPSDFVFVLLSGIMLSIISSILPAISITKDTIVSGLRYE